MANEQPEKMNGASLDIAAEQRARLKELFPTVFTETTNDAEEMVESVDFGKLQAELGTFTELFEARRERYGMDWPGKKDALRLIQTPSHATLKPCREESVNFDTTEHLFIEGDNLEVLKLLQKSYYGKVKMIYIDPPYNTGKEFIYPDNYTEDLQTYLEYAGLVDSSGKKFSTNTANEGRFHTKWLNMMYPRLYLARNLLRDDGVIFISIDDNEVTNLKKLCDEVFGEENFLSQLVWKKKYIGGKHAKHFVDFHEYVLVYGKVITDVNDFLMERPDIEKGKFEHTDEYVSIRGEYYIRPLKSNLGYRETLIYPIQCPDGSSVTNQWMVAESTFFDLVKDGRIVFKDNKTGGYQVYRKFYENDGDGKVKVPSLIDDVANANGKLELKEIFGVVEGRDIPFENPKPVGLINYFVKPSTNGDDIILDFFAGSATTAHSVMDLNKQDDGHRKFILVQLPEPCADDSEAFKAGYHTIADIGKERIRRVIQKMKAEQEGKLDLQGDKDQDRGFRVLKLDQSNFKQWRPIDASVTVEQLALQLTDHVDHVSHATTQEALLFEILLKAGFQPTAKAEVKSFAGVPVFSIAEGALLICLAEKVTKELIDQIAEDEPMQFICLDSAFGGNDQLKSNAVQTFAARNLQKEKHNQIVFKTV